MDRRNFLIVTGAAAAAVATVATTGVAAAEPGARRILPGFGGTFLAAGDDFGSAGRVGPGTTPDIAVNRDNVVVEVHQAPDSTTLWSRVGRVEGDKVTWGPQAKYDDGVVPSVAITDDGTVVEVHQSQNISTIWYHVGKVDGDRIRWSGSNKYDDGVTPMVAITNDGTVVEVHQSQNQGTIWYHTGKVRGDQIAWSGSTQYDNGVLPSVAMTGDGTVVEVHQSQTYNTIWYHIGKLRGDEIAWGESIQYDDGQRPSIALTRDGLVVEVHAGDDSTWSRGIGEIEGGRIKWRDERSHRYGKGLVPRLDANAVLAVEIHASAGSELFSSVLPLSSANPDWLEMRGPNAYCYCLCNGSPDAVRPRESKHTMNVAKEAPCFYAVITKNPDTADFPDGAKMTVTGPDGTRYDRDTRNDDLVVITAGDSLRCLIVRNPKPGEWKMTMSAPPGVGFHCECNTVPSADVYDTIISTKQIQKRGFLGNAVVVGIAWVAFGPWGAAAGAILVLAKAMWDTPLETTSWILEFMWKAHPASIAPTTTEPYHAFLANITGVLTGLSNTLEQKGYDFVRSAEFIRWFGKNFSKEEFEVVVASRRPVERVLFVYALVYFEVRHMTDAEEQNAVRHALWQCYLKKAFTEDFATKIGDAHEKARPGTPADNKADEINNRRGQRLADQVEAPYQCFDAARKAWRQGELQARPHLEGDPT